MRLGWMSNWQYAGDVPTSPWRNAMTVPRELDLRNTAEGLRLVQEPVAELEKMRGLRHRFPGGTVDEANAWITRDGLESGPLDLAIELAPAAKAASGLKLFECEKEETVVRVDRERGRIFIDRKRSGNVVFHAKFSGVASAPIAKANGPIRLRIYVDACSVEVFANDGEKVLASLSFPSKTCRAMELFGSKEGATVSAFDAWPMESCWKSRKSEKTRP